ncbi:replicative DNA helicase [Clostridium tyrobutyricum]|uniref:replicative DNA helicase n=1 Tax=Clostridium tyrobutyricum TaxID=1519 RepID=UPI001C38A745|nr:replicative DNA helicase [Clostridium tyrobutyricum]MBV4417171.1 replicative DNA helicase [Clostridium tyrobutyricum]
MQSTAMPHSMKAESALLGSILNNSDVIIDLIEVIKPDDFYKDGHKIIFKAMLDLFKEEQRIDIITLSEKLKDRLSSIGGITYISELAGSTLIENAKEYAAIIKEKSNKRKLIVAADKVKKKCFQDDIKSNNLIEAMEEELFKININQENKTESFDSILEKTINHVQDVYNNGKDITGIDTGFKDINRITGGLQRQDLIILAARPSMGKTTLAVNLGTEISRKNSVCIFSMEMSKEQIAKKIIASKAHIDLSKLNNGKLVDKDWSSIGQASGPLSQNKLFIDDTAALTLAEIRAKCKKIKMQKGLDVIIIDYLQLMNGHGENRTQEISKISRGLKQIAKDLDIIVIALSQLSRACEVRTNHRPILSDLRESGSIEQDADIVMFLYRDEYYDPESEDKNIAECIFAKDRNGKVGTIKLAWLGEFQKFGTLDYFRDGSYRPEAFKEENKQNFEQESLIN